MKVTCKDCFKDQLYGKEKNCAGIDEVDFCIRGVVPKLSYSNKHFWQMFLFMLPGVFTETGLDYNTINIVFDWLGKTQDERAFYLDKILTVYNERTKIRNLELEQERENAKHKTRP